MLQQIDHVVIVVNDLDEAIEDATAAGFAVTPGGEHTLGQTRNALIAFQDGTYVELLAFVSGSPDGRHYFSERHRLGFGLAEFSLLSDDLDHDIASIAVRGVPFPPPTSLGRNRPDGVRLEWRMSLPATLHPRKGYPFLIEDTTNRSLRVPFGPEATNHPNGSIGVAGVTVVVDDLEAAAPAYRAIVDAPPDRTTKLGVATKGILRLELGGSCDQWIALMQTFPDSAPDTYFRRFGAGPYAVNLRTEPDSDIHPGDGTLIDPNLLSSARFYL
jgi:hypothetical protein